MPFARPIVGNVVNRGDSGASRPLSPLRGCAIPALAAPCHARPLHLERPWPSAMQKTRNRHLPRRNRPRRRPHPQARRAAGAALRPPRRAAARPAAVAARAGGREPARAARLILARLLRRCARSGGAASPGTGPTTWRATRSCCASTASSWLRAGRGSLQRDAGRPHGGDMTRQTRALRACSAATAAPRCCRGRMAAPPAPAPCARPRRARSAPAARAAARP